VPPMAIIEASNLPMSEKKKLQAMVSQPDPAKEMATKLAMAEKQADIGKTQAEIGKTQSQTALNVAKARTEGAPGEGEPPKTQLDIMEQVATIDEKNATAEAKRAQARNTNETAKLGPLRLLADNAQRAADREMQAIERSKDRAIDSAHRNADRAVDTQQRQLDRQARPRNAAP